MLRADLLKRDLLSGTVLVVSLALLIRLLVLVVVALVASS
jgi:hypothetical protein